ncbi:hypothetical protein [Micromonospora sp. AMSO31t]|uniref:hypothetical protein n=1 Tax=Micromonospora sp. AMSO31t TaxID=2650566 RepID=UPI00124B59C7|nr:hypothetical protein F8274_21100 [Micromonospora sp. AMSO31t]
MVRLLDHAGPTPVSATGCRVAAAQGRPTQVSLADVDRLGTTVSAEDAQCVRHWVWCDRLLDGGRRCPLRADHDGECSAARPR